MGFFTFAHMFWQVAAIAVFVPFIDVTDTLDVARVTDTKSTVLKSSAPLLRMDASALERTGAISLQEALRTFAGVSVRDYGGLGGLKTVCIRSFGAQHTGIIYDGQVISNAQNGQVDIGRFNLDDVQSIAVELGGSSDIFRSARLAGSVGVLSVETARPAFSGSGTSVSAALRYGSFNTWNPYFSLKQRLGRGWCASVWGNYVNSRGNYPFILHNGNLSTTETRLHSDVSSFNGEASVYGDMGRGGTLALKLMYYDSERGLPGSVVLYTQNPHQRLWDRDFRASALYEVKPADKWKLKASASYNSAWNRFVDYAPIHPQPQDDRYLQQEGSANAVALFSPWAGVEFSLAQDVVLNTLQANIPGCPFPTRITSYTALSGKYERGPFLAVVSLLGTGCAEWVKSGEPAPGRFHLGPSASISYRLPVDTELRLRASFKDSFRLPTFNDLYYARVGNRTLRPEKAMQTNLGITWGHTFGEHRLSATADAYWNAVRDRIVAVPSLFIWSMRNVGRVLMLGSDLNFSYRGKLVSWLWANASAAYSYQYAVDITDPSAKNYRHQIAYTPRHSGSAMLAMETPWVNLGYTLQAVGERYTLAQNIPAHRIDPYFDHILSFNHTFFIGKRHICKLFVSAEALNLAGVNYEVVQYYPMPGRQYRFTIKFTY